MSSWPFFLPGSLCHRLLPPRSAAAAAPHFTKSPRLPPVPNFCLVESLSLPRRFYPFILLSQPSKNSQKTAVHYLYSFSPFFSSPLFSKLIFLPFLSLVFYFFICNLPYPLNLTITRHIPAENLHHRLRVFQEALRGFHPGEAPPALLINRPTRLSCGARPSPLRHH